MHTYRQRVSAAVTHSVSLSVVPSRAGPQQAGEGSFIWHEGPVDRPPRLALLCFFFCHYYFLLLPFGISRRGVRAKGRPSLHIATNLSPSVPNSTYGDGRGKHVISVRPGRHKPCIRRIQPSVMMTHTHTHALYPHPQQQAPTHPSWPGLARLRLSSAAAPAWVAQGLISRVRAVYPSLPHAAAVPNRGIMKQLLMSVTATRLHCITSAA